MGKLPTLTSLLKYKNPTVLGRYKKDHPANKLSADQAFTEMLKYLWLGQRHKLEMKRNPKDADLKFSVVMLSEMGEIDDMWHTFLLFTEDYMKFCKRYFGVYVHHNPLTRENKKRISREMGKLGKKRYLSYIYDNLGAETLKKWLNL